MVALSPTTLLKDDEEEDIYSFDHYVPKPSPAPEQEPEPEDDIYSFDRYVTEPEPEPAPEKDWVDTTVDVLKDTGVDVSKGVVQLGQSIVGLGGLLSGGLLSDGMRALGYRPEDANQMLSDLYSDERKAQELEFEAAKGFKETALALVTNPRLLGGKVAETAPQMIGIIGSAKAFAARAYKSALDAALKSGAKEAIAKKVALEASMKAATKAAATAEGAMQGGSSFDQYMQEGMDLGTAYVASIGSGITTGLTAFLGGSLGKKIGLGDIEAGITTKGGAVSRVIKGGIQEGTLEEMPQSGMEQAWDNWAHERPLMEGVEKAMGVGLTVGAAAGGGFNMVMGSKGEPDPNTPDQTPELFRPTHEVNGQPVQQVTKRGEVVPNTFINQAGEIVRTPAAVQTQDYDPSMDVDAVASQIQGEINDSNPYNLINDTAMPTGIVGSQMPIEPNLGEAIPFDEGLDQTAELTGADSSQLFTDVMGEDISYAEDIAAESDKAANSPNNDLNESTEAQNEQGNYTKGHPVVQGFNVSVETPEGADRKGTDASGKKWSNVQTGGDYGYIKRTIGADSDPNARPHEIEQVDVTVKKGVDIPADNPIYVIDQTKKGSTEFDETKVMLGYASEEEAREVYLSNYEKGWKGLKAITQVHPADLKTWLADPAANDEYSEYLKGTPKVLKPVVPEASQEAADGTIDLPDRMSRADQEQTVYHATFTDKVGGIKKGGLKPFQTSNWTKRDGTRYNKDAGVFAFENAEDAARWAFKMNYDFGEPVSVVKAKRDNKWDMDPSGDIHLQMGKGKALRRFGNVPPEDILESADLDMDNIPKGMTGVEYLKSVTDKLSGKAPFDATADDMRASKITPQAAAYRAGWERQIAEGATKVVVSTGRYAVPVQTVRKFAKDKGYDVRNTETGEHTIFIPDDMRASKTPAPDVAEGVPVAPVQDQSDPRLARAREQGFDTTKIYYHSSKQDLTEFKPRFDDGLVFLTSNPEFAAQWAAREPSGSSDVLGGRQGGESGIEAARADADAYYETIDHDRYLESMEEDGAYYKEVNAERSKLYQIRQNVDSSIYPVFTSAQKTFDPRTSWKEVEEFMLSRPDAKEKGIDKLVDMGAHKVGNWIVYENPETVEFLKGLGYDSMLISEDASTGNPTPHETLAMFDSSQIRSINASFMDPTSNEMLARKGEAEPAPYDDMRGLDYTYQVRVQSTGQVHTLVTDSATVMEDLDARVEALEELRKCVA